MRSVNRIAALLAVFCLGLVVCLVSGCLVSGAARADASAGARMALQWCANCHVVNGKGPSATVQQGPPAFSTIAGHMDSGQLRAFLSHPHGAMPDLALSRAEINDLIDYIETLK
jgi:mono/diheme cytochrome c family protein